MIFPVWQPIGSSSHMLTKAIGAELGELATHTGTLDPMAEGVLVILTGEDRFVKGSLHDWLKTYSFSILWGVSTDSADKLGCVTDYSGAQVTKEQIVQVLKKFPHHYAQKIPEFSARRVKGKSSFDWAKDHKEIFEKKREVKLSAIICDSIEIFERATLLSQHHTTINLIKGNFRQEEVLQSWKHKIPKEAQTFLISHHTVTASPGTYIRQLVSDLSNQLGAPATTWRITRTVNGPFTKEDCFQ